MGKGWEYPWGTESQQNCRCRSPKHRTSQNQSLGDKLELGCSDKILAKASKPTAYRIEERRLSSAEDLRRGDPMPQLLLGSEISLMNLA